MIRELFIKINDLPSEYGQINLRILKNTSVREPFEKPLINNPL